MESFFSSAAGCCLLSLAVVITAIPVLALIEPDGFRLGVRKPLNWIYGIVAVLALAALLAFFAGIVLDPARLLNWGRIVGALINLQLIIAFFALLFPLILLVWPYGGAVSLAAFLEGIRQPMFWMMTLIAAGLMYASIVIPYFTFGEDARWCGTGLRHHHDRYGHLFGPGREYVDQRRDRRSYGHYGHEQARFQAASSSWASS